MQPEWKRIEPILTIVSGLLCLLFVVVSAIPIINYVAQVGAAFGFIYLTFQRKYLIAVSVAIVSIILGGVVFDLVPALIFNWATVAVPSIVLGTLLTNGFTPIRAMTIAGGIAIGIALILFGLGKELIFDSLDNMKTSVIYMFTSSGLKDITLADVIDEIDRFFNVTKRMMPSFMALSSVFQLFIGWLVFCVVQRIQNIFVPSLGSFVYWKMPAYYIYITGAVLIGRMIGPDTISMIADNILLFVGFFYAVFGLSLLEYYLKKIRLTLFMRIVFYFGILLLQVPGLVLAAVIGFFDSYFDFRKVRAKIIG